MGTDSFDTVMVMVHEKSPPPFRIVMLDAGIATSLAESDLKNFKDVFKAVCLDQVNGLYISGNNGVCKQIYSVQTTITVISSISDKIKQR